MDGELATTCRTPRRRARAPLAVPRRAAMSPRGLWHRRDARARHGCLARLVRRAASPRPHEHLGHARRERGDEGRRIPHVWHLREIYMGFERYWPAYRRLLADRRRLPCVSQATAAPLGGDSRARSFTTGSRSRRSAARATGAPRPRPPARRVRLRDPRPHLDVEGPDVLIRALADPALAGSGRSARRGDPWQGEESPPRRAARAGRAARRDRAHALRRAFATDVENVYGAADVICMPFYPADPFPDAALEAAAAAAASSPRTTAACRR